MAVYRDKEHRTWFVKTSYKPWNSETHWTTKRGFATKKEAEDWEMDFKRKWSGSLAMSMNSFAQIYISSMEKRLKPDSLLLKKHIFRKWILPYLGDLPMNAVTSQDVLKWQDALIGMKQSNGKGLSKSYLATIHNQCVAIFTFAERYYGLPTNPVSLAGSMGTFNDKEMQFWTDQEYQKFAAVMKNDRRYYPLFEVLYYCGLRVGEVLALTQEDINFIRKEIHISKTYYVINGEEYITAPKTENSVRYVTMPDFLCDELKEYLTSLYGLKPEDRIFPLHECQVDYVLKKGADLAGVKRIRVHDLRHSHVSMLIHMGFDPAAIAKRVGHKSVYITMHYAHMFPNQQTIIADNLDKIRNTGRNGQSSSAAAVG